MTTQSGREYPPDTRLIWKFDLRPWTPFIDAPEGATILSAGVQRGEIVVWARCNPNARKVPRMVAVIPTGAQPPTDGAQFVGTVQTSDGLVFHVYDGGERAT